MHRELRAQPGYGHQNKFAVAVHEIPKFKPHLVIWEVWLNDTSRYVLLGDTAYNTDKLITQEDGYPALMGLSGGFNQWLLSVSKLYEFAAFTLNEDKNRGRVGDLWKEFAEEHTRELIRFVKEQGAELWVATCPPLHTPFEAQRRTPQRNMCPSKAFSRNSLFRLFGSGMSSEKRPSKMYESTRAATIIPKDIDSLPRSLQI